MAKKLLQVRFTPENDPPRRLRQQGNQRKLDVLTVLLLLGHRAAVLEIYHGYGISLK